MADRIFDFRSYVEKRDLQVPVHSIRVDAYDYSDHRWSGLDHNYKHVRRHDLDDTASIPGDIQRYIRLRVRKEFRKDTPD